MSEELVHQINDHTQPKSAGLHGSRVIFPNPLVILHWCVYSASLGSHTLILLIQKC